MEFFDRLFDPGQYMPHGHCYFWKPEILWLHVLSDALIASAYFSIPVALMVLAVKRRDLKFRWAFGLFMLFIFACGTTHLMEIVVTWRPYYELEGLIKAVTAFASVATALLLWPLLPKALALPSPTQLEELNASLEQRVDARTQELAEANVELRQFNTLTIGREERVIALKREVNALARELGRPEPYDLSLFDMPNRDGSQA